LFPSAGQKQSDINKPILNDVSPTEQADEPKKVNVNLSFGRQNTSKPTQETKEYKATKV
jgi:hypothetical protein